MGALEGTEEKLGLTIAMRADFLVKCMEREYSGLARKIEQQMITVLPMKSDELASAIVKPARQVGLDIASELVTEIINDIQGAPGSLPLLQYTLKELWQARQDNQLTFSAYQSLGGIQGTLDKRATAIYEGLDKAQKRTVRHIFQQLTQIGEGTEDTRRRVFQQDLISEPKHPADRVQSVIANLSSKENRLLVTSDATAKSSMVEPTAIVDVAHEALIRHWKLLRGWIIQDREMLLKQRRIEASAVSWRTQGQQPGYLLQGRPLVEAKEFNQRQADAFPLSDTAKGFIDRSQRQRRCNRLRTASWLIIPAVIVGGIVEFNLREASVNQDYGRIQNAMGTSDETQSVVDLVRGCKGKEERSWLPRYLSERLFGNCRSLYKVLLQDAYLSSANLSYANLNSANLSNARLSYANLSSTNLGSANLSSAKLWYADLYAATLYAVDLSYATLSYATLSYGDLHAADLSNAYLYAADLSSTNLYAANLLSADLLSADLSNANLSSANLSNTIFLATDLRQTKGLTQKQFETDKPSLLCNSPLPEGIDIDPNRDCDKLPQVLANRDPITKRYPIGFATLEEATEYINEQRKRTWD